MDVSTITVRVVRRRRRCDHDLGSGRCLDGLADFCDDFACDIEALRQDLAG
jgi:hypothetical protein